jgi:copper transport protein
LNVRRTVAIALIAGLWLVLTSPAAFAHALVRSSDPADGAVLEKAPAEVLITFTEAPDPGLSVVHVLDSSGQPVEKGATQPVPGSPLELRVALGTLGKGVYTVTWRTVSQVDGHVTGGSFSFGVGVPPAEGRTTATVTIPSTPPPSPLAAAGRWAFYWGLAILLSAAAMRFLVFEERLPSAATVVMVSAWILAAVGHVAMVLSERSAIGVSLGRLFSSTPGHGLIRQAIGLAVAGVALLVAVFGRRRRFPLAMVGVAAAGTLWVHAQAGHADASGWIQVGVQWVHLVAVSVWVGGLLWLLLGLRGRDGPERAGPIRRFSRMAGIALSAVVVTGVSRELSEVGGPTQWRRLFDTSFGVALLIKVGLIGVLVSLGAFNRYVNVPGVTRGTRPTATLRRTVGAELMLAVAILGVTSVLTQLPPAKSVANATRRSVPQQVVVTGHDFATSVRVRLVITPGAVGPNTFSALVSDYDTGRPVDATRVSLSFGLHGRADLGTPVLDLTRVRPGLWATSGTVISMDGRWDVSTLVQSSSTSVQVPLSFLPRLPSQRIQVSSAPGQPTLYTIALAKGASLQSYVDPGKVGNDVVHFTFFQSSGNEQPVASATGTEVGPSGVPEDLQLNRLGSGHFAANVRLAAGQWRFHIRAQSPDGTVYDAYFQQRIS